MEDARTQPEAFSRMANEVPEDWNVLTCAWRDYERSGLPLECSQREQLIARQAYVQGARALFGILCTLITISDQVGSVAEILEYLGAELGIDERRPPPS